MNIELRDPNTIMKLSRLGSFHQSKLSFLRSFLNEFKDWDYKRDLFDLLSMVAHPKVEFISPFATKKQCGKSVFNCLTTSIFIGGTSLFFLGDILDKAFLA